LDRVNFWEKPLAALDRGEWEALCDGCGRCCLHKAEDEDTGEIHPTNIACRLLDRESCRCTDYANRRRHVADCVRLDAGNVAALSWLPATCAYRLRAEGKPLPDWHYLRCGDREAVHQAGMSVRGWTVGEDEAGDILHHLVDRAL
jgi:uncharacterized cysteine cluster protein YcgN (CxxCxxCC family)